MKVDLHLACSVAACAVAITSPADAQPIPRQTPISGRIIGKKVGETVVLVPSPQIRPAQLRQDLKAGDVLRTNATGTLAIVFADRTQIRLGPNAVLAVKQVQRGSPSTLQLQRGSLWARSPRSASHLSVETPSATAAIRGTEYSIVAAEERTSISVIEGAVEFFNPQGSVQVTQGQAAVARLGEAPTRIFTVNPEAREQMLYYLALEEGLGFLRPAPHPQKTARAMMRRIRQIPSQDRTAEDWLSLAENGAEIATRAEVQEALSFARKIGLTPQQEARATLVDAGNAARDRHFVQALSLYQRAYPLLEGRQKEVARYGIFITRTLTDPTAANVDFPPLDANEAVSYVGQAFLAAFLGDFARANQIAEEGLERYPEESSLYAIKAGVGLLTGKERAIDEAAQAALEVDPEDPFALAMQSELEMGYRGQPEEAIKYARRAVELAPGDDTYANNLSNALFEREHTREADRVFRVAIAENPASFLLRGNYAIMLLQTGRVREAREQLEIAKSIDPDNALTHLVDALLNLTMGKRDAALESALAAATANPTYAEALLVLAEIYYSLGDEEVALQQVDAADRADPNSPFVPLYRAAMAIDRYRADDAIVAAREAVRRYRARGGVYASLSESRGSGSYIAGAFRFLDLEEWGRYHGDRTFDPFVPATLFDRALARNPSPYLFEQEYESFNAQGGGETTALSNVIQGLRLDPLSIAGSERELHLTRQKFLELTATPSFVATGGKEAFSQAASVSGLLFTPAPFSFSISASRNLLKGPIANNNDRRQETLTAFLGVEASPFDNILLFGSYSNSRIELPGTLANPRTNGALDIEGGTMIALFAHEFGRENVLSVGGGLTDLNQGLTRQDQVALGDFPLALNVRYSEAARKQAWVGYLNYAVSAGPLEIHAGFETISDDTQQKQEQTFAADGVGSQTQQARVRLSGSQRRFYLDGRHFVRDWLILQGQAAATMIRSSDDERVNFDLSLGVAAEPAPGHWLRAAYMDFTALELPLSLAPTGSVGLQANALPGASGKTTQSFIGRWDAEWSPHVFTSVEFQHQDLPASDFPLPNLVNPIDDFSLEPALGIATLPAGRSALDRITVSGNFWLTHNLGLTATYAYSESEVKDGPGAGGPIPFLSRHFARSGITWTHPRRIKVKGTLTYTGDRPAGPGVTSEDQLIADLQVEWQPLDKRVQLNAGLFNIFDSKVDLVPGVPGFGRTLALSLEFRF